MDKLPKWSECDAAMVHGEATTLQRFIYDNEPSGQNEVRFRHDLLKVLNETTSVYDPIIAACTHGAQVELPELLAWIADRFEYVYKESPNVDFVQTIRRRGQMLRTALDKVKRS
jgi:hypothetical protein